MGRAMERRVFLRGLFAGGAAVAVSACGGGGGVESAAETGSVGGGSPPTPAPAPTPTPTPPPVPTLKGQTIEQAQADIAAPLAQGTEFFETTRTPQIEVTVANADEFQAAVDRLFDVRTNAQALATHQRIVCAWNGASMLAAGVAARVTVGGRTVTTSHLESGGSLTIVAAPGQTPDFANTVYVSARGVKFEGIGFTRKALPGENADAMSAVILNRNSTYPVSNYVAFERCAFGSRRYADRGEASEWINGIAASGHAVDFASFKDCVFIGMQNATKVVAKALRMDGCDFQAVLQDCVALYGHRYETDYYSHVWISRSTFRNSPDDWASRSAHSDTIQTGTSGDRHRGYRLLVTDVVSHLGRSYSGEAGLGGGTQGIYNDDHTTADNQFVVRRSIFLVTAPHGFCYYSPQASRPSFVDESVFMRAGRVPSAFAPDTSSSDMTVGITGNEPSGGPWLLVTNTIGKRILNTESNTFVSVDPRLISRISNDERPETIFAGRDFTRGGAASNFIPEKFAYTLPNETGQRDRFVADVWANFQAKQGVMQAGVPNLASLDWRARLA